MEKARFLLKAGFFFSQPGHSVPGPYWVTDPFPGFKRQSRVIRREAVPSQTHLAGWAYDPLPRPPTEWPDYCSPGHSVTGRFVAAVFSEYQASIPGHSPRSARCVQRHMLPGLARDALYRPVTE